MLKERISIICYSSLGIAFLLVLGCSRDGGWLSPVKITDNICSDETASINYDGSKIVYSSNQDGDYDIYLIEFSHGIWKAPLKLTDNNTPDTMPVINAEGSKIAYIGGPDDSRKIFFIEYRGGAWQSPVQITFGADDHYFPTLSADGEKITYQSKDAAGNRFIWFVERKAGIWQTPIELPTATDNNMFPVINADGTRIGFYGVHEGYRDIYFLNYSENTWHGPLDLTDNKAHDCQPSINADGTKIVYYSTGEVFLPHVVPGAVADIFLLEEKNGVWQPPVPIAAGPYYEFDPTIDASGNRITYAESIPGIGEHIYVTELSEGSWRTPINLTQGITSGYRPYISGDGNTIIYYGTGNIKGVTDVDNEIYVLRYKKYFGTIAGQVTDQESQDTPLEEVLIKTEPGGYLAKTDAEGNFILNVLPGTYFVTAQKDCFTSESIKNAQVSWGKQIKANFALKHGGNCAPLSPHTPLPETGSQNQPLTVVLQWECSDPDAGDNIYYDVYVGTQTLHHIDLLIVSGNQSGTFFTVTDLAPHTIYYWKVVARDSSGHETAGPQWNFTTTEEQG